jgi:predicted nuclease of predicted toxin-antitoxin system
MVTRLLLDTCVWGGAKPELIAAGHDVIWAGDWASDPGDEEILAQGLLEQRIIVTLDKDFGELAILRDLPHAGIIRLVDIPARQQAGMCKQVLDRHANEIAAGAIVTVQRGRVRIRPARSEEPG